MRVSILASLALSLTLASCSLFRTAPRTPPVTLFEGRTATLAITSGIELRGQASLPPGFAPMPAWPPMWLLQGSEVAVSGVWHNRVTVLGFSGPRLETRRLIAADDGGGAPDGRILDLAASPDGMELATAVEESNRHRLQVFVRDLDSNDRGHSLAAFEGDFGLANLKWLNSSTLVLALREAATDRASREPVSAPGGLYMLGTTGIGSVNRLERIGCYLSPLSLSPSGRFAVAQGDAAAAPTLLDLKQQSCVQLGSSPIHVLDWAPDSSAFLFVATARDGAAVWRYELKNLGRSIIALSSSAAGYASDGTIVALGNSDLSRRRIVQASNSRAIAQIALIAADRAEIKINSLGFATTPALLAASTMTYSTASDAGAIDALLAVPAGARDLIEYLYPSRSAYVLARGGIRGPLIMRWSPDGAMLALVDGDASGAMLTVFVPPG